MTKEKKEKLAQDKKAVKYALMFALDVQESDFRDFDVDKLILSITTIDKTKKLELVINSEGDLIDFHSKDIQDTSFTIKNNRIIDHAGL